MEIPVGMSAFGKKDNLPGSTRRCLDINSPRVHISHLQTVPDEFRARLCNSPAAMAIMLARLLTWTGDLLFMVVPSPNCP